MRKLLMLLHTGDRPDIYLNLSLFLEHIGVFVYDNREVVLDERFDREDITAFVYLVSDEKMVEKLLREINTLKHGRVIVTENMRRSGRARREDFLCKNPDIEVLCDDRWESQIRFILKYLASGSKEYQILNELYKIFNQNNLIRAYYCSEYMQLGNIGWDPVLEGIGRAVSEFKRLAQSVLFSHVFYAEALAMKRFNDICQKIFRYKRDRWTGGSEEEAVYYENTDILRLLEQAFLLDSRLYMALIFVADLEERIKGSYRKIEKCWECCVPQCMNYYVSYKRGLFYQRNGGGNPESMFWRSVKENPGCYRSQYKLGLLLEKRGHFEDAVSCYKKILNILHCQTDKNYLHPIEYEYVVKSYFRIGYVNKEIGNLEKARACFKKAQAASRGLEENLFIKEFLEGYIGNPVGMIRRKVSQNSVLAGLEEIEKIKKGEWV